MLSVASSSGLRKRRHEFEDSDNEGIKLQRAGFYFVLESESDISSEEDTESISSIQNKSTDYAKDTSDTSTKTSDCDSTAILEYEVMSLSDREPKHPFDSCSGSSGTPSAVWQERLAEVAGASDSGDCGWGDDSSSDKDTPERVSLQIRTCVKCRAHPGVLQYCAQCYKVRKEFFPTRPKRCRKKSSKPLKKKSCSKEPPKLPLTNEPWIESSSSQELTPSGDLNPPEGLCNVCFKNPKNGAFLHCRWVHIYSCYQCSLKIWFSTKNCPLCNSRIRQVLKVAMG